MWKGPASLERFFALVPNQAIGYHDRVSADDDVKELIETNFKLLAMSLREASVRSGEMESNLGDVKDLAEFNKTSFEEMATRLDQTLEAIKVLAFGGAEAKKEILDLRHRVEDLQERLSAYEKND